MEKTHSSERLLCLLCRWTLLLSLLGLLGLQPPCVVQGKRALQNHALDPQLQLVDRKLITVNDKLAFSVLGDPGMKSPQVRVEVEAWDFCNRVGNFSSGSPSPRWADCADLQCSEGKKKLSNPCTLAGQHICLTRSTHHCRVLNKLFMTKVSLSIRFLSKSFCLRR